MKIMCQATGSFGLMSLAACLSGMPSISSGGVYDDCTAWYHLDYAPNYNSATSNFAKVDEIRDQRDWGTAATKGTGGKHATAVNGPFGGPQWTNCPVVCPAGGEKYGAYSLLFQPATNSAGLIWNDSFSVPTLKLPGSSAIVTRFLWNGFTYSNTQPGWIFNNSLDWNAKSGWMFGVRGDSGGNRLGMFVGQTAFYLDNYTNTIGIGKWYDAAAVLTDNGTNDTVELYLWPQDGPLLYKKMYTSAVTNATGSGGAVIGGEPAATGYADFNSNNGKTFKGIVNHLAVWNRALSYGEVAEAFGYPQPLFQIGLKNGSPNDLRVESEVDAEYLLGDAWNTMRRAVTPTYSNVVIKLPLTAIQSKLDYVFHVRTATESGKDGGLSLTVNSTTNAALTAGNNKDLYWFVTSNMLTTGTNSFTLLYAAGPAAFITFDWMELGGSWQLGAIDNNQADFSAESAAPDDFFVTDTNWVQHLERALTYGDTNLVLHFSLSSELAAKYFYTYSTRIIGQGPSSATNYAFSVNFNNLYMKSYPAQTNGTYITLPIDRSYVKAGDNTINLMYNGPATYAAGGGWMQFDFHRLSVAQAPKGSLILMR